MDRVYVISGTSYTVTGQVDVGNGPTGLAVLSATTVATNKVFVAHQYGANFWRPGLKVFEVDESSSYDTADGGYVGAAPVKVATNKNNGRVYVSNYLDKLAVVDGASVPPETLLGYVFQGGYQGAYGIDVSEATNRVYLATRDTGELVVFNALNDALLAREPDYVPVHVKPPEPCNLWSVAVNETTGHVFVPCPQLGKVFVLDEDQLTVQALESLGVVEVRDGERALVVAAEVARWLDTVSIPGGVGLGEEGIAVDTVNARVFITNASNDTVVVLDDSGSAPVYDTTVVVGTTPQGIAVNENTQKVYVGNAGSKDVTVLSALPSYTVTTVIPLP
jgi:DNA-binding beta-propeller fold protein YncE